MNVSKKITVTICDDVREEVNNKFSFMGIYGQDMVFPKFPVLLPKLCFCIMLEDIKRPFQNCQATLKTPESDPIQLDLKGFPERAVGSNGSLFAILVPFRAQAPGEAKLEVRFDKSKRASVIHRFQLKGSKRTKKT